MKEQHLILLLQIIRHNGRIDSLVRAGFEYSQIANFIDAAKAEGLIYDKDDILTLSQNGIERLEKLNEKFGRKNADGWISPQEEYRCKKIDINEIYIPSKKRLKL